MRLQVSLTVESRPPTLMVGSEVKLMASSTLILKRMGSTMYDQTSPLFSGCA